MEYRRLGRTGLKVSILTIGGYGPGVYPDIHQAINAVESALNEGLNMIDIAPSYGDAEVRLGPLIKKYRERIVIAEKTLERSYEGAWRELRTTLSRFGVNSIDIYQFHAVSSLDELDKIFGENGAMKAFLEARDQGIVKFIGITVHSDMRIALKALEMFDFDTILIPVYAAAMVMPRPENDFRPILKVAMDRDIGVIAIKSIAKKRYEGEKKYTTWYEPFDNQEDIDKAVWYTLSQEPVATYSMAGDVRLWPMILSAGKRFKKLSIEEQKKIIDEFKAKGAKPLFPETLYK
jgi:aryl-alcohol dehydrogenase-like predicted oxidoreductase|uniref:Aldo/keto reductase n=1 Tax=Ignisphaera aggregans TaxID=334771 RepID=A0A7J2TZJ2_9CREN